MFTGIIERTGKVKSFVDSSISVDVGTDFNVKLGDSVSINGVCLTATKIQGNLVTFDVSNETLKISTIQYLNNNDVVNLERAMLSDGRFGGHFVTGHVDTVAKVLKILKQSNDSIELFIEINKEYEHLMALKGSIAINGVSLTINGLDNGVLKVTLIPYSVQHTNLKELNSGSRVNIEFDILARYVVNMLKARPLESRLTEERLRDLGYVK